MGRRCLIPSSAEIENHGQKFAKLRERDKGLVRLTTASSRRQRRKAPEEHANASQGFLV